LTPPLMHPKYSFQGADDRALSMGSRSFPRRISTMSRLSVFNSPLLLGFDHFERVLDRISKTSAEGYPPYNIEQRCDNTLRITLAVAGFAMADLTVGIEDNQLIVRGRQAEDDGVERVFLHRGIASRQFQRSFVLAEGIEVVAATLDSGLLHIDLQCPTPETRFRSIPIRGHHANDSQAITVDAGDTRPGTGS
jgi:HSP20 family molecular chaperone IbpA